MSLNHPCSVCLLFFGCVTIFSHTCCDCWPYTTGRHQTIASRVLLGQDSTGWDGQRESVESRTFCLSSCVIFSLFGSRSSSTWAKRAAEYCPLKYGLKSFSSASAWPAARRTGQEVSSTLLPGGKICSHLLNFSNTLTPHLSSGPRDGSEHWRLNRKWFNSLEVSDSQTVLRGRLIHS